MNAKKGWKRIGWFPAVILLLSLAKLWMIRGLVIYPLPGAACDDALMTNWALNIASGGWTGPFSNYTFMKEVGFAFYLAVIYLLRLPYIFTTNLIYLAGCLVLLYAVSHVAEKKWSLCIIYVVLLFHPVMTAVETGQRVYRNALTSCGRCIPDPCGGSPPVWWITGGCIHFSSALSSFARRLIQFA